MKKSIKFLLAAFVITIAAASCNKPAESTSDATDSVAIEAPAPAPIEEAPADSAAVSTDSAAVAQ